MSSRLERIIRIDQLLRAGICPSPADLASRLEVSRRTIYDDRQFMIGFTPTRPTDYQPFLSPRATCWPSSWAML